VSGQHDLLP